MVVYEIQFNCSVEKRIIEEGNTDNIDTLSLTEVAFTKV